MPGFAENYCSGGSGERSVPLAGNAAADLLMRCYGARQSARVSLVKYGHSRKYIEFERKESSFSGEKGVRSSVAWKNYVSITERLVPFSELILLFLHSKEGTGFFAFERDGLVYRKFNNDCTANLTLRRYKQTKASAVYKN